MEGQAPGAQQVVQLRLLLDAVATMASDLTLDGALGRIVAIAGELAGARYAALGVLDPDSRRRLRTFVHHGISAEDVAEIGALPTGHGLLGALIDDPRPIRLHDLTAHPATYGFPAHHPPMHSFLGVPIRVRGQVFGNLYLTEKEGGVDFSKQDEELAIALALAAGVAIENARLHERAAEREHWLAATAEITALLGEPDSADDALQAVADLARSAAQADVTWVVAATAGEPLSLRVVSGAEPDLVAMHALSMESSLAGSVVRSGVPLSIADLASDPRAVDVSEELGWPRIGPALAVPLRSTDRVEGALAIGWTPEHAERAQRLDPALAARFAEQAALTLQVGVARSDRQRVELFEDRDRIGRDLHDLVIQRLFAVGLTLDGMSRLVRDPQVADRLTQAVDDLDDTIKDIRRTIFALGSMSAEADVQTEVTRIVDRAAATLKFLPSLSFEGPVRALVPAHVVPDLLAVLGEALSNASRHAQATAVAVVVAATDQVTLSVADDGRGLPEAAPESGLGNMRQRALKHGGSFEVSSAPGQGTRLTWSVPFPTSG